MSVADSLIEKSGESKTRSRLSRYAPLVIWLCFIFTASTDAFSAEHTGGIVRPLLEWLFPRISEARIEFVHFLIRKGGHLSEYAVLALLAARAFLSSPREWLRRNWFAFAFALVAAYALLDEYHQSFVPSRTASIKDSFIDMTGGAVALLLVVFWRALRRRKSE